MSLRRAQDGYVLLLVLLAMMGVGGAVLAGYTQQAKHEQDARRYEYNKRVLQEAKQALLQYAFDYPVTSPGNGPGRLPCPDTDVPPDGIPNPGPGCSDQVGRFPWNAPGMNFYDARDASNERLWYAVSSRFDNFNAGTVNSDTDGTITISDQSGGELYDGGGVGIAAVIIAPGPAIARDENDDGIYEYSQVRNAVGPPLDPENYLDTFNGFRNDVFKNIENDSADDSFILGPVRETDPNSPAFNTIVVNDQMILITTDEVARMAQKSALYHYKTAINNYRANLGIDAYPWLDDYTTTDLTRFDGNIGVRIGRVPSMFAEYFSANPAGDGQPIISELEIDIDLNVPDFDYDVTLPASPTPDVLFDTNGDLLSTSFLAPQVITRYFWDGHDTNTPSSPADGIWEICPPVTFDEEDCNQNGYNNFIGGTNSVDWMKVRRVTIILSNGTAGVPFRFPLGDFAGPPVFTDPDGASHAKVTGSYSDGTYISVSWTQDDDFQTGFLETPAGNNGTIGVNNVAVTLIYYPALPEWAHAAQDDWHDSIQFAFSPGYAPGAGGACTPGTNCLTVENSGGVENDKIAVLVQASENPPLTDDNALGYQDDLSQLFDGENAHAQDLFPGTGDDDPADGILDQDVFAVRTGNDDLLVVR